MTPKSRTTKRKGGRFSTLAVFALSELRRTGEKTCAELREALSPRYPDLTLEQVRAACMELCNARPEPSASFNGAKYVAVAEHADQPVASARRRK